MLKAAFLTVAAALLVTNVSAGQSQPSRTQPPAKPDADVRGEMIELAARIVAASKQLSMIWPGYWPEDQAFIIHAERVGALLISPGPTPPLFHRVPEKDLPDVLSGRAFFHKETLGGAARPFVIGYPIGEGKTALLANRIDGEPEQVVRLILHEQFHGYQAGAFKGRQQQFVDPLAVRNRVAFAATAEVERAILAAALAATSSSTREQLLRQYFAVRRDRERTMPAEVVKVERDFERIEGTAQYADVVGQAVVAGGGEARILQLLNNELRKKLASEKGAFSTIWFRSRGYNTGAALTYLISKYERAPWRKQIENGASPDMLLEKLLGEQFVKGGAKAVDAARRRFGYEAKMRELEPIIRSAEKNEIKSVAEFRALGDYQITFEPGAAGSSARPGFQARNMTLLSPTTTALPLAIQFSVSGESFHLTGSNRPVLLDAGKERRFTVLLKEAPTAEGIGTLPLGEQRREYLKLVGDGYELKIDKPVIVVVEARRMVVRLID